MKIKILFVSIFSLFMVGESVAQVSSSTHHNYAIASAHPIATRAGIAVLQAGGNAFDAAVAVSATLAVVEPYSSGLGGGGFWLLHRAKDKHNVVIDGRERAPYAASETMFLDKQGDVIKDLSVTGPLAAGIPGEPAALVHIAQGYGKLPLAQSLASAIAVAKTGFKVSKHYQQMATFRLQALRKSKSAARIFLFKNDVPPLGHRIIQADLARTLQKIADSGQAGFYQGTVAKKLVKANRNAGGIWSLKDLSEYKIIERAAMVGKYQGYQITSVPPPSSGGVALLSMFNMLAAYQYSSMDAVTQKHLLVEIMRRAYRDRAEFLGDSDYVDVPLKKLTSTQHAIALIADLKLNKASKSSPLAAQTTTPEGRDTTHFSIIDSAGNRVAATLSINYPFGSGFVATDTGVLLNDEMDDFSAKAGVANVYGLVGAKANAIEAGKRMLSSMSPSFIENDQALAIIGTPGGSRIISMVFHGMLSFIEGADATAIVNKARFHHQYLPDTVQFEKHAFSRNDQTKLKSRGHALQQLDNVYGNMQVIVVNKKSQRLSAASDKRGEGLAIVKQH